MQRTALDHDTIRRVRRLALTCRRRVSALLSGEFRSHFRGTGIEFETVREYVPGDDVRALDWNVTARLSRPYVKQFVESRERQLWLVVDRSASMEFGSNARPKSEVAAELAAVLVLAAAQNRDAAGLLTFGAGVTEVLAPRRRPGQVERILLALFSGAPSGTSGVAEALDVLEGRLLRRSVVVLISDFHEALDAPRLVRLARRHEVVACSIFDPRERALAGVGLVDCVDPESGAAFTVDAGDARERADFAAAALAASVERGRAWRAAGVDHLELSTADDVVGRLLAFFESRQRRGRR